MQTLKLVVFFLCYGFTSGFLDNHGITPHPNTENVGNGDLSKTLLDKIVEQEIKLWNLLNEQQSQKQKLNALNQEVSSLRDENKHMKDQIASMNTANTLFNSKCSCPQGKQNDRNATEMEDLRKQYRYLALSILDLQAKAKDNLNKTEMGLRQLLLRTQHEQANMSSAITNMSGAITHMSGAIADVGVRTTKLEKWENDTKVKVSFTAGITARVTSISDGQTLIFNKEITNIGGGYNPTTGVFTSSKKGIFVFYSSTYTYDSGQPHRTDIVLNGNSMVRSYAYDHDNYAEASSALVVLRLQTGDKVWVRHNSGTGYYTETQPLTTFSGFML